MSWVFDHCILLYLLAAITATSGAIRMHIFEKYQKCMAAFPYSECSSPLSISSHAPHCRGPMLWFEGMFPKGLDVRWLSLGGCFWEVAECLEWEASRTSLDSWRNVPRENWDLNQPSQSLLLAGFWCFPPECASLLSSKAMSYPVLGRNLQNQGQK